MYIVPFLPQRHLANEEEVICRERGHFGTETNGFNATMQRGVRGHLKGIHHILRNARKIKIRPPECRPDAVGAMQTQRDSLS